MTSGPDDAPDADFVHLDWRSAPAAPGPLPKLAPGMIEDDQFRLLADNIPTLCWIANADGYIVWYNRRWHEYCGTTQEEMEGWGWQSVHDPHLLPDVLARWTASVATGEPFEMTFPLRGADGVFRPFLTRIQPVRDENGQVARWFGVNTEISGQLTAEAALRESEERLGFLDRLGVETAPLADADAVLAITTRLLGEYLKLSVCAYADMDEDEDGFTIRGDWAAPGSQSIVGHYSLTDFGKLAVQNLRAGLPLVVNDNLRELAPEEAASFRSIGIAATICMPLVKEGRLTALMAVHDRVPRTWTDAELGLLREVTARSWSHVERVAAIAELRASEVRYRTLFESIESGFCVVEVHPGSAEKPVDYRVVEANPAFYRQTGFPKEILCKWLREAAPGLEEHWFQTYGRVARTGEAERFEQHSGLLDRWFDVYAFRIGDPDQPRVAILFNDISARRDAEERLRQLNDSLESQVAERTADRDRMWKLSTDIMLVARMDATITAINPAWTSLLGYSADELVGRAFLDLVHPADKDSTLKEASRLAGGETTHRFENRYRAKSGSYRWISWIAVPSEGLIHAVGRDITAEKEAAAELEAAQDALRQSQKMEAMGQLTGGVAHDFNNLLTPIVGSLDMLLRNGTGNERERKLIAGAMQSADRAKTLVQRLLAFARRQPLQPSAVDVTALVTGMADLVASTSGPQVRVVVETADDLPPAKADPNQLEMALLNLGVNARDAMPDGGTLRISAALETVGPGHRSKLRPAQYVLLSVADTGVGMDEATLARSVEPFFSTKGIGKGTGLGLSMVHGLASQLGGALTIESRPNVGTNVELWLPLSTAPTQLPEPRAATAAPLAAKGTALLVDDEDLVRISTAEMLANLGYQVSEAACAEEALALIEGGLTPDIIVTDHLMPGMSGTELADVLSSTQPGVPIIIVSGYAEVEGIAADLPRLAKPFRQDDLAEVLAETVLRSA